MLRLHSAVLVLEQRMVTTHTGRISWSVIYLKTPLTTHANNGLWYLSVSIRNPSSGSVNQSHGGSWAIISSYAVQVRGSVNLPFISGVSLSRATSMFVRHCFIASNESATSWCHSSHAGKNTLASPHFFDSSFIGGMLCGTASLACPIY